ncbi:PREDICTED: nucleolar protein 12 [Rhagoletis zephyria]|uniref:nucleolar protein 12 n=1 Tax=Rhagoletis zephyria TaxID=28612 RepID=UPI000811266E|nr:PREDICTED: nucleolar protein 12 [Rhagoletis zephyria]
MDDDSSDSDYHVEEFVKPKRVRHTANGDEADLLGNFDDVKRKEIFDGTYEEKTAEPNPSDSDDEDDAATDSEQEGVDENSQAEHSANGAAIDKALAENEAPSNDEQDETDEVKTNLTKQQLAALMRGTAKANRHVLYVTNLNFETTGTDLEAHFSSAGTVKGVRIPKKRRGGFAFVEMADIESYQRGFQLHNSTLQGRTIKVQFSEAGKKKSANKKNILKQKNRKLAEMRNEQKTFTKSGKFYDKNLKKEKAKDLLARKRWRKPTAAKGARP